MRLDTEAARVLAEMSQDLAATREAFAARERRHGWSIVGALTVVCAVMLACLVWSLMRVNALAVDYADGAVSTIKQNHEMRARMAEDRERLDRIEARADKLAKALDATLDALEAQVKEQK